MKPITMCSTEGCGLMIGYDTAEGKQICWLHAEKQKLPAHRAWLKDFSKFAGSFGR